MTRRLFILSLCLAPFAHAEPEPQKPPTELRILGVERDADSLRIDVAVYNRTAKSLVIRNLHEAFTGVKLTKPDGTDFETQISQINLAKPLRKTDFTVLKPGESKTARLTLPRITAKYSHDWFNWNSLATHVGDNDFNLTVELNGINVREKLAGEIPSPRVGEAFPESDYLRQEEKLKATSEFRAKDVKAAAEKNGGRKLEPFDFGPHR